VVVGSIRPCGDCIHEHVAFIRNVIVICIGNVIGSYGSDECSEIGWAAMVV
jgi:hypothetical protein